MLKRLFDLLVSFCMLVLLWPVLLATSLVIYFKLGAPIIFTQQRPGCKGRSFYIYKFRTMTDKRDSEGKLLPDEIRLTSLGKWMRKLSLDEIPQLLNVVKGELSLVGPRPLLMEYLPLYSPEQARRHDVKPGITGWAQVNGRNAISWEEKFKLDVWYVDHQSFWLDLKILWMTAMKVVKSEGISQKGQATMEAFKGTDVRL